LVDEHSYFVSPLWENTWTEGAYPNLIDDNKVDKGGHFAASEQPQTRSDEGFRPLG
jgi:hypothetical protein